MDCNCTKLTYGETGYFSNIVTAYISGDEKLKPFYKHPVSIEGIANAIEERKKFKVDRKLLVEELTKQYSPLLVSEKVNNNISLLAKENTFTICTAHQPAIFSGNLFFIYKILHTVKLAEELNKKFPENNFVPVFYMGSEDADLDELGHIYMEGEKISWDTKQKGAIGRMKTRGLEKIIARIEGELSIHPHGAELVKMMKECYLESPDIQTATLKLVHRLFGEYGLIVLIPDNPAFKKVMIPVFEDELFNHRSNDIVQKTIASFPEDFKVQAQPREINLFYLKDDIRERIERNGEEWRVVDTNISFNRESLQKELHEHPERFSPNVILRGLFQETILPDVTFIGGGGEVAYWLELKNVFENYKVPYPVLIVRNSFLVLDSKWKEKLDKLRISIAGIFKSERELLNDLVKRESENQLSLAGEITDVNSYYDKLKTVAGHVDDTLTMHVAALQTRAIRPLQELEKKLLRAERRKFNIQERQLQGLKKSLFPNDGLQERVDNFMPYFAKWGKEFIGTIYQHSLSLEQEFTVLACK
jgi:bacillithiol biosynthesis cysteine-adding enzyme BshC